MTITVEPQGGVVITATQTDAAAFANRPGKRWPGSDLSHLVEFSLTVDAKGDLVDMDGDDPVDPVSGAEVSAFIEYALWEARSQIDELLTIEERKHAGGRA